MHTVELLKEAISVAEKIGFRVRQEYLGGQTGGGCEILGRKCLFLDLDLGPADRLEQVVETLRREPATLTVSMVDALRQRLELPPSPARRAS